MVTEVAKDSARDTLVFLLSVIVQVCRLVTFPIRRACVTRAKYLGASSGRSERVIDVASNAGKSEAERGSAASKHGSA